MQTQNAAFLERKGPERKPWSQGKHPNCKKHSQRASILPRKGGKALNPNLSAGPPSYNSRFRTLRFQNANPSQAF